MGHAGTGPRWHHSHHLDRHRGGFRWRLHRPEPLRGTADDQRRHKLHSGRHPWRGALACRLPAHNAPGGVTRTLYGQSQEPSRGEQMTEQSGTGSGPLQTERGNTNISDSVVSKMAGIAAQEVDGIRMGSGASQTASNLLGSITGGSGGSQTQGVSVEVGQEEAALDLTLTAEYGKSVPQLAEAVRRNVINRVENLVGLRVTEVNLTVSNIFFPQQEAEQQRQQELEQQRREQEAQQQQRVQ